MMDRVMAQLEAWKNGGSGDFKLTHYQNGALDVIGVQRPSDTPDVVKDAKAIRRRGWYLRYSDSAKFYTRGADGVIRRKTPKLRGKAAVKAAKRQRQRQRTA